MDIQSAIKKSTPLAHSMFFFDNRSLRAAAFTACIILLLATLPSWAGAPENSTQTTRQTRQTSTRPVRQTNKTSQNIPSDLQQKAQERANSVYENQPAITNKELTRFLEILPQFRNWCRANNESPQPVVRNNKADFTYSKQAADWVNKSGWQPERFFCIMGRLATALAIVEEGNSQTERPQDMPAVQKEDIELTRRYLSSILKALDRSGGNTPPIDHSLK